MYSFLIILYVLSSLGRVSGSLKVKILSPERSGKDNLYLRDCAVLDDIYNSIIGKVYVKLSKVHEDFNRNV